MHLLRPAHQRSAARRRTRRPPDRHGRGQDRLPERLPDQRDHLRRPAPEGLSGQPAESRPAPLRAARTSRHAPAHHLSGRRPQSRTGFRRGREHERRARTRACRLRIAGLPPSEPATSRSRRPSPSRCFSRPARRGGSPCSPACLSCSGSSARSAGCSTRASASGASTPPSSGASPSPTTSGGSGSATPAR